MYDASTQGAEMTGTADRSPDLRRPEVHSPDLRGPDRNEFARRTEPFRQANRSAW